MIRRGVLCVLSLLACGAGSAAAQSYPTKPVRMLVGFAAGGSVDLVGRILGQRLSQTLGQQVIIDNRPGAASNIAGDMVAKAAPDGYTLLVGSGGGLGGNAAVYRRMPYDAFKDLVPIGLIVIQGNVLIVNASVPAKSVKEMINIARTRPGILNGASGGSGSSQHLTLELFNSMAGLKIGHVPYKGGAPAMADLLGGQVDLMFQTIPEALPHVKGGRIRVLAVTTAKRSGQMPEVPTMEEAGMKGFTFEGYMGLAGPAGMPREVVTRLNKEINDALADNTTKARYLEAGLDLGGGTPEQLGARMRAYADMVIKLAKEVGIKPVD